MARDYFPLEPKVASPAGGKLIALVGTPSNGHVPIFNSGTGRFEPGPPLSSAALDDLSDVDLTGLADGDVLTYDSGSGLWVPGPAGGSLALDDLTDVDATSPNDGDTLVYDSGSGTWIAGAGGGAGAEPPPYTRRETYHQATPNLLSYQSLNLPFAFSGVGSSSVDNLNGYFCVRNATSATIGSVAGVEAASMGWFARDLKPIYVARQATYTSVADVRFWFGLASATPSGSADPSGVHLAAFRYDTATDGTAFWRCCTKDGTTMTVTATGVAIATDTVYLFRIETDSSAVRFYIDGNLVATHTTNLPGSSTAIGPTAKVTALAAAAKSLRHSRLYLSWLG
jgi:hypothetical protein